MLLLTWKTRAIRQIQQSEGLASLGIIGARALLKPIKPSQHYHTEESKGGPSLAPLTAPVSQTADVILRRFFHTKVYGESSE